MCVHAPNIFKAGSVRTGPLSQALISPATGEMLFQADVDQLRTWKEQLKAGHVLRPGELPMHGLWGSLASSAWRTPARLQDARLDQVPLRANQPLRCEDCGAMTTDGCFLQPARGTCVCRSCLTKRRCAARREGS